jgi:purine nucleosidase
MSRTLWIDTDTASDDAVALVMALRHPEATVAGISVVAGNVGLDQAVQNALYTVELCGRDTPVHAGAAAPLEGPLHTAQDVHGQDGMGDIGLPLRDRKPTSDDAIGAMIRAAREHADPLTLVTLGPLTNIALALRAAPDLVERFDRVVVMGGTGQGPGNITPVAEFNIWVDPEAADEVFTSGLPIEMVGWDVSYTYATMTSADSARLRELGPIGEFCVDIQACVAKFCANVTHLDGYDLPDPITMAVAIDPSIATRVVERYVRVETAGTLTRGQTVVDHLGICNRPANTRVVLDASRDKFLDLLARSATDH